MTEVETLLKYMEKHQEEFVKALKGAVLMESPTEGDKDDLQKCCSYFEGLFAEVGCKCTVVPSNDGRFGDHLLIAYGEGDNSLLFVGHYDTVYEKGTFGKDLWRRDGDRVWGAGALDMKGGDVQVYMIIRAIKELGLMPENSKIIFFLSSDEEAGSRSSHMHYEELAKKSRAAFVMESAMGDYAGGCKIGRYGRGNYTFLAKGVTAHSGLEPYRAESGLIELAKQAVTLEALTDYDKVVTVACTCLKAGNAGWPTVPGEASLTIDARFSSLELALEYDKKFYCREPFNAKVSITTTGGLEKPPFDKDRVDNKALYENAVQIGKAFGLDIKGRVVAGGSDGNFTSAAGCPTLDGLGMTGDFVHQPGKEYINLESVAVRGAFVAKLALEVLRGTLGKDILHSGNETRGDRYESH